MHVRSLVCLALIHTLVDGSAQLVTPLWPLLKKEFGLAPWVLTLLLASWQVSTSVSQPLFGYWGDRFGGRWMLPLGPVLALVCLSLLGYAGGPAGLALFLVVGGLGIGAFHPEAAAAVADAGGQRSTGALALFLFGGMLGLGLGPMVSGTLAGHYGLRGLAWILPPGLLLLAVLFRLRRPADHHAATVTEPARLTEILAGRWRPAALLLLVATLRVVPAVGVPLGLAFLLDAEGRTTAEIGRAQGLFLVSGGVGTLIISQLVRPGRELGALTGTIFPAAGCLVLLTFRNPWAYYAGLIGSGLLLQGVMPLLISYSQRLLPRGRRLAASLTLGASWGLGGLIVAGLQAYFTAAGRVDAMVWAMVPFAVAAAVGSCLLPRLAVPSPLLVLEIDRPRQPAREAAIDK